MSTTSRGTAWRTKVSNWLLAHGATDVTTSRWLEPGDDLRATFGRRGVSEAADLLLSVEAKDHRKLDLATWVKQAEANAGDRIPVVIAHRIGHADVDSAYVVLSGRAFLRLVQR